MNNDKRYYNRSTSPPQKFRRIETTERYNSKINPLGVMEYDWFEISEFVEASNDTINCKIGGFLLPPIYCRKSIIVNCVR